MDNNLKDYIITGPNNEKYRLVPLSGPEKAPKRHKLKTNLNEKVVKFDDFTGAYIRKAREDGGFGLRGLSRAINITPATLCNLERGKTKKPHKNTLIAIAHKLGIKLIA